MKQLINTIYRTTTSDLSIDYAFSGPDWIYMTLLLKYLTKIKTAVWNDDNSILSPKYFILPSFRSFKLFKKLYLFCEIHNKAVIKRLAKSIIMINWEYGHLVYRCALENSKNSKFKQTHNLKSITRRTCSQHRSVQHSKRGAGDL
jgi:hypothetical protein